MKIFISFIVAISLLLAIEGRCAMVAANNIQKGSQEGKVVVCFKEGISKEEAEKTLLNYNLKFKHTEDPKIEKIVFYKGEKFIIKVPEYPSKERSQIEKMLNKDEKIKGTFWHPDDLYIHGEIVVGFEKGVSREEAEKILSKYKLKIGNSGHPINLGRWFFYETGEKFIIQVPEGKEDYWIKKLKREKKIKHVSTHADDNKIMVD